MLLLKPMETNAKPMETIANLFGHGNGRHSINIFQFKDELEAVLADSSIAGVLEESCHFRDSYYWALDSIIQDAYEGDWAEFSATLPWLEGLDWELRPTSHAGQFGGATHEFALVSLPPIVVMNEQHTLLPEQAALLPDGYTIASVPAQGWDLDTIRQKSQEWGDRMVILVSPIPALMSIRAKDGKPFQVFHNDRREKKELPDGRIIHTVAKEGWQLV